MSYEVTATRRRPQKFDDLIGQEFVAETLKNTIKSGKIAHAYLFTGPRGCGKTSTARILAKALNCQNGPTDTPCGQCANCREITSGSSLDVIEIDGASNNNVDNIRQIKDEVLFPPTNSRYKIYIIDEVHMLSNSAFNALLKTIEEPPAYVIFIFATTELQKVPATIKSRCQQFNFRLVPIEKVKNALAEAARELNIQADEEALFWIARESTGSMRDAYTLFDQIVAFSDGHITYDKIRDKLGLVGVERLNSIFEKCADSKTDEVINQLDSFLQSGVSIEQLISNCADYLRSLLLIKNGITRESLIGNNVERFSQKVLATWSTVQVERALSLFLNLYRDIRYSLSPRYELELLFSRMCWINQYVSSAELKKAIDAAQSLLLGAPASNGSQNATPIASSSSNNQPSGFSGTGTASSSFNTNSLPTFSSLQQVEQAASNKQNPVFEATQNPEPAYNNSPNGLPPGMPTFSALSDIGSSFDDYQTPPDDAPAPEETSNPFSYGGELPPEQSASPVDSPVAFSEPISASLSSDTITSSDGTEILLNQIRGQITAGLSVSDGFAAIILEKTGEWKCNNDIIFSTVETQYDYNIFMSKKQVICSELTKICGRNIDFQLSVEKKEAKTFSVNDLPPQVKILIDTFRGSL